MDAYPLEDFVLTAAAVLAVTPEEALARTSIGSAESALAAPFASFDGVAFYPDPIERAAILASRINRNHPLPDGNKRVALICMVMLLELEGYKLVGTQDERAKAIEQLAAGELSEAAFVEWLKAHVSKLGS